MSKEIKIFKNEHYFSRISSEAIWVLDIFWNTLTIFLIWRKPEKCESGIERMSEGISLGERH